MYIISFASALVSTAVNDVVRCCGYIVLSLNLEADSLRITFYCGHRHHHNPFHLHRC